MELQRRNVSHETVLTQASSTNDGEDSVQDAIDFYFNKLATMKDFICSPYKIIPLGSIYGFLSLSAIVSVSADNNLGWEAKLCLSVFILIQVFCTFSSIYVSGRVLRNEAMCNAYVEYKVNMFFNAYPSTPPVMSLYFTGHIEKFKKKSSFKAKAQKNINLVRLFSVYIAIIVIMCIVDIVKTITSPKNHSMALFPWTLASVMTWNATYIMFDVVDNSLEFHKRGFLSSSFFNNKTWDLIMEKLASISCFRSGEKHLLNVGLVEDNNTDQNNDGQMSDSLRYQSEDHGSVLNASNSENDSTASTYETKNSMSMNPMRSDSVNSESLSSFVRPPLHSTSSERSLLKTILTSTSIEISTRKHYVNENHAQKVLEVKNLLVEEGNHLDVDGFRRDLYVLQHAFQVHNHVLGSAFSTFVLSTILSLAFTLFLTIESNSLFDNSSKSEVTQSIAYLIIVAIVNIFFTIRSLLWHNAFAPSIQAFCDPISLLCPPDKYDDFLTIKSNLISMNLYLKVFGIAITKEWLFSFMFSLAISGIGQIYILVWKYTQSKS